MQYYLYLPFYLNIKCILIMYFCAFIVFEGNPEVWCEGEPASNQTSNKAKWQGNKTSKLVSRCHVQYSSILDISNQFNSRSYSSTTRVWRHWQWPYVVELTWFKRRRCDPVRFKTMHRAMAVNQRVTSLFGKHTPGWFQIWLSLWGSLAIPVKATPDPQTNKDNIWIPFIRLALNSSLVHPGFVTV